MKRDRDFSFLTNFDVDSCLIFSCHSVDMGNQVKDTFETRKCGERLSISDKLKIVHDFTVLGVKQSDLVKKYKVHRATISRIVSKKSVEKLKSIQEDKSVSLKSKVAAVRAHHPNLDQQVYSWFLSVRNPSGKCKPLPVSRELIQTRARQIAESLGVTGFQASDGCFRNWRWRYDIGKSVRLHGEAGDVDLSMYEELMEELKMSISSYDPDKVFNMDETGIIQHKPTYF